MIFSLRPTYLTPRTCILLHVCDFENPLQSVAKQPTHLNHRNSGLRFHQLGFAMQSAAPAREIKVGPEMTKEKPDRNGRASLNLHLPSTKALPTVELQPLEFWP